MYTVIYTVEIIDKKKREVFQKRKVLFGEKEECE